MIHALSAFSGGLYGPTAGPLAAIQFPNIDPVIFHIGPVKVRWYGMAYLVGFALGYWTLLFLSRRGRLRISTNAVSDLIGWLVIGVMVGGRAGWWIFYHVKQGPEPWYEPVAVWHGGMSFHGGLIGVLLVIWVWCRLNRVGAPSESAAILQKAAPTANGPQIPAYATPGTYRTSTQFWNVIDGAALVVPIGLFFGRIANFINAELIGRPSNLPWAVMFPGEVAARHPSQIYEAILEGPVLFGCLWIADRWLRGKDGKIAGLFVILYGLFRFSVEFTREPDKQLGFIAFNWLTMGQLLSLLFAVGGVVLWWLAPGAVQPPSGLAADAPVRASQPQPRRSAK